MQHETELDPMDLPFDLEADIGIIKEASLECPGFTILRRPVGRSESLMNITLWMMTRASYPKLPRDMGADCRSLRGSCSMTGMINRADAALLNMRLQNTDTGIIFLTRLAPLCMTLRYITWSTIRSTLEHIRHRRAPLMDIRRAIRR